MFKQIWKTDATPVQLIGSIIISLYVMNFISVFVGSMGGVPAFLGFLVTYYLLRIYVENQRTITENFEKNIRALLIYYGTFYLVVWGVVKFCIFIARALGWGNVDDLTFSDYFSNLYGSTFLEKWAYVFAGILMYSFVMSLFPIIIIKAKRVWIKYLIIDSAVFALICFGIACICRINIDNELEGNAVCVLDDLLLCEMHSLWLVVLYIVGIIFVFVATVFFVYKFALKVILKEKVSREETLIPEQILKRIKIVLSVISIFLILIIAAVFFMPDGKTDKYRKVAEYITDDNCFGPMIYGANFYIPVTEELNYYEQGIPLGYIGYKDQNCDSRFYRLTVNNVLYCSLNRDYSRMQMFGKNVNSFKKAELVEQENRWMQDEVFVLWDEDWQRESVPSAEITGYSECTREFVLEIEETFGDVTYNVLDFKDYDAYFTISSYADMKDVIDSETPHGNWVGCILVKDNEFFYGNYNNKIYGSLRDELLEILGGS